MASISEKITIITGAAAGIGEAMVRRFVADGARVMLADFDETKGRALAGELGESADFVRTDVSEEAGFKRAIEATVERWGRLNILVNNAGIALPSEPVESTTLEEFDRLVRVNLRGVFIGCKYAYPHLKNSRGCVLNISSMSGVTGQARHAAYGATKGGINALTKCMAVDWGREGIRVNALCPCGVWTDTLRRWMEQQSRSGEIQEYLKRIHSLHYCPEPEEIASVASFLCSDDAMFVTGCIMPVSGGSECGYNLEK